MAHDESMPLADAQHADVPDAMFNKTMKFRIVAVVGMVVALGLPWRADAQVLNSLRIVQWDRPLTRLSALIAWPRYSARWVFWKPTLSRSPVILSFETI